jgi:hypothetical protein
VWPSEYRVDIIDNIPVPGQHARVVLADKSVTVLFGHFPILIAVAEDASGVVLRLDLRPIGMNVFDDAAGLHVGANSLSGNRVSNSATAISLA